MASYDYNGHGERVGESVSVEGFGGSPVAYVYDEGDYLLGEYAGAGAQAEYAYLGDTPLRKPRLLRKARYPARPFHTPPHPACTTSPASAAKPVATT